MLVLAGVFPWTPAPVGARHWVRESRKKAFAAIVLPKSPTMGGLINFMGNPCCIMFSELGGIENNSFALDPCSYCACHCVQGFGVKLIWVFTVCSDLIVRPLG